MQHLAAQVFGGITVIVALIAWMGGPAAAGDFAGNAMHTVGVTVGAVVHGVPDMIEGFQQTDNTRPPKNGRNTTTNSQG